MTSIRRTSAKADRLAVMRAARTRVRCAGPDRPAMDGPAMDGPAEADDTMTNTAEVRAILATVPTLAIHQTPAARP